MHGYRLSYSTDVSNQIVWLRYPFPLTAECELRERRDLLYGTELYYCRRKRVKPETGANVNFFDWCSGEEEAGAE